MSLEPEDLTKLRRIAVAIVRHEMPTFADLEWLIEQTYALDAVGEELDKEAAQATEKLEVAESQRDDGVERIEELESENHRLAAKLIVLEGVGVVNHDDRFRPERLEFLRNSLAACLQSVDLALADKPKTPATRKGRPPRE